jgi:hypothetical protein
LWERLTDGFSEKSENLKSAAYALHFAHLISVGFIHRSNVPRGNGSQDHKARLDFQFAVLVSTHLTQRGESDCTTIGAFYNVAS